MTLKPDFAKYPDGLVPTIVVDDQTQQVLMMAYMNAESYRLSWSLGKRGFGLGVVSRSGTKVRRVAIRKPLSQFGLTVMKIH